MVQRKFAARMFILAGMVFLLAAVVPVFRGQPSKMTFTTVGIAFFAIGLGAAKKSRSTPGE